MRNTAGLSETSIKVYQTSRRHT